MPLLLLIDDDVTGVTAREMLLRSQGYQVISALSGTDGLKAFSEHQFDLVVLDLELPDCNGFAVLQQIKATAPESPVLVLSGLLRVPPEVHALANAVLLKGEGVRRVLDTVAALVSRT